MSQKFKGYKKSNANSYYPIENEALGLLDNILFLRFDNTNCSIETQASEGTNSINSEVLSEISAIRVGGFALKPNKIYKIIGKGCGEDKKLVEFYEFFPKTVNHVLKAEDITALTTLCAKISGFIGKDMFKTKQEIFTINNLPYAVLNSENYDIVEYLERTESSEFDKFAIFFSKTFFPLNYADWNKNTFEKALIDINNFESKSVAFIQKYNTTSSFDAIQIFVDLNEINKNARHLIFDRLNVNARKGIINALLNQGGDFYIIAEHIEIISQLIMTTPTADETSFIANFTEDIHKKLAGKYGLSAKKYLQIAKILADMKIHTDVAYTNVANYPKVNEFGFVNYFINPSSQSVFVPFTFNYQDISASIENGKVKFTIKRVLSGSGAVNTQEKTFTTEFNRPIFVYIDAFYTGTDLSDNEIGFQGNNRLVVIPAFMLYAIQQKTRSEIVATNVKRVAHGAVITLNVVGVVASFGSLAAAETVAGTLWATTCLVSDIALLSTEFMSESEMKALHDDPTTRNLYYACHAVALIQLGKAGWDFLLPKCQNDIAKAEKAMKDLETYAANKGKTKLKNTATECIKGLCFTAGTRIATEHGAIPIEKITKNTKVWSWDFEKNALSLQRVVQTFERTTTKLIHLFIGKDTIHTTPEHPFYVPQIEQLYASTENNNIVSFGKAGSWVAAKSLKKGAKVFLLSSLLASVDSIYTQDTICTVYNFEVEQTHNYFVGKEGVLVHNDCASFDAFVELNKLSKSEKQVLKSFIRNNSDYLREWDLITEEASKKIFLEIAQDAVKYPRQAGVYDDLLDWGIRTKAKNNAIRCREHRGGKMGVRPNENVTAENIYELRVNPNAESFYIKHPDGKYVQFENIVGNKLQDAKWSTGNSGSPYMNPKAPYYDILEKAKRQVEVADNHGLKVEWLINDEATAKILKNTFADEKINIIVTHYP